jgi:hypothetical protein
MSNPALFLMLRTEQYSLETACFLRLIEGKTFSVNYAIVTCVGAWPLHKDVRKDLRGVSYSVAQECDNRY